MLIDARQLVDNESVYLSVWLPVTSLEILSFCGSRGQAVFLESSPQIQRAQLSSPPFGFVHAHNASLHCMFWLRCLTLSSSADTVVFLEPHVPRCPVRQFCLYYPYDVGLVWFFCLCMSGRSNTAQTLVLLQPLQHGTLLCWTRVAPL